MSSKSLLYNNDLIDNKIVIDGTNQASNLVVEQVFQALKSLTGVQRRNAIIVDSKGRQYIITRFDNNNMILIDFYDASTIPVVNTYIMRVLNNTGTFFIGNLPNTLEQYTDNYGSIITIHYFR